MLLPIGGIGIVIGLAFFSSRVIRTLGVRVCKVRPKQSSHLIVGHWDHVT